MKKLSKIFNCWYGVNLELINCEEDNTGIPFVSRTSCNNGVVARVSPIKGISPNPKHTLSLAGGGSVLSCFYQDEPYYSGRDLFVLSPIDDMSKEEMILYSYIISANKYKYNYGRQANKTFQDLILPELSELKHFTSVCVDADYQFDKKPMYATPISLDSVKWNWFRYDEIFSIQKGKRLTKTDMIPGNMNYIGATDANNGVTAKIGNTEYVYDGNKITVSYNGSIAEAFYQADPFWATDDVNVLSLKHYTLNVHIAMFLTTLIHIEKYRFNYGRKWDKELMLKSKIKLPIKANGNPDWKFMENYIKSLPYSSNL